MIKIHAENGEAHIEMHGDPLHIMNEFTVVLTEIAIRRPDVYLFAMTEVTNEIERRVKKLDKNNSTD